MKCEVFWKDNGQMIHEPHDKEATHLTIVSPLDDSTGLTPTIYAVCEAHADIGALPRNGWVKISSHVAKCIGQMEEALRLAS